MPTPESVARRLRHIRHQQSLTLKQVEIRSRGRWKAVVVGSYERGTRTLSIHGAEQLCEFYGVPISQLFTDSWETKASDVARGVTIDLRKLRSALEHPDDFCRQIHAILHWISIRRDDWNGEVLSIRGSDKDVMMLVTQKSEIELARALEIRKLSLQH